MFLVGSKLIGSFCNRWLVSQDHFTDESRNDLNSSSQSGSIRLRAPVSESLTRLGRDPLQKFAQYLIAKLPEQILPIAQEILDDLLSEGQTGERVCVSLAKLHSLIFQSFVSD